MKELLAQNGPPTEALLQRPVCYWALNRSYIFQSVSGNSAQLFNKSPEALGGSSIAEVLSPELASIWKNRVDRVFQGESLLVPETAGDQQSEQFYSISMFPVSGEDGSISLAAGCAQDITAWRVAEQQLRTAALKILDAQEHERARLSRLLHDTLGQSLSAAGLQLDVLRMDLENRVPDIGERTAEIQEILEEVVNQIRDLSYQLQPAIAERVGLHSALERLVGFYTRSFRGTIRLMSDSSIHLPRETASAMYKIAREAIQISIQYARCTKIELLIRSTQKGQVLEIRDDGEAFNSVDASDTRRGLGFMLIQHYAAEAGLDLSISNARGKGTVVQATYFNGPADDAPAERSRYAL